LDNPLLEDVADVQVHDLEDNNENKFPDQDEELENDPNAGDQLKGAESNIQDWSKDLTLPEKSDKVRKTLTLPEKSAKSGNSVNKLSGEINLIPGNKFDRKPYRDDGDDDVEADDGDGEDDREGADDGDKEVDGDRADDGEWTNQIYRNKDNQVIFTSCSVNGIIFGSSVF